LPSSVGSAHTGQQAWLWYGKSAAQPAHSLVLPENAPQSRQSCGSKICINFVQMFNIGAA